MTKIKTITSVYTTTIYVTTSKTFRKGINFSY